MRQSWFPSQKSLQQNSLICVNSHTHTHPEEVNFTHLTSFSLTTGHFYRLLTVTRRAPLFPAKSQRIISGWGQIKLDEIWQEQKVGQDWNLIFNLTQMILKSQGSKKTLKYCSSYINGASSSLFCNGFVKTHSSSFDIRAQKYTLYTFSSPRLYSLHVKILKEKHKSFSKEA